MLIQKNFDIHPHLFASYRFDRSEIAFYIGEYLFSCLTDLKTTCNLRNRINRSLLKYQENIQKEDLSTSSGHTF